jgi:hypothetical protein
MYQHACSIGLEGVVSKVRDSRYRSGRSNDWVKKTCAQRETLPIAGFALNGNKWDGIYLGRRKGKDLVYAGKVDHGFDTASAKDLQARLKPLIRKTQPYTKKIAHRGIWVEPSLRAEIEYRAKSAEGKVRHPFFKGVREDSVMTDGSKKMVWVYVDTNHRVGHPDHLRVFATPEVADEWFKENDPEGVALGEIPGGAFELCLQTSLTHFSGMVVKLGAHHENMPLVDVVRKNGADMFPQMSAITIGRGPHTNVGFAVRVNEFEIQNHAGRHHNGQRPK